MNTLIVTAAVIIALIAYEPLTLAALCVACVGLLAALFEVMADNGIN